MTRAADGDLPAVRRGGRRRRRVGAQPDGCRRELDRAGDMGDWWGRAVGASAGPSRARRHPRRLRVRASPRVRARERARCPQDVRTAAFAVLGAADMLGGASGERRGATHPRRPGSRPAPDAVAGLELAGGPPALRQRHPRGGADRRGARDRRPRPGATSPRIPRSSCSIRETADGHLSVTGHDGRWAGRRRTAVRPAGHRGGGDGGCLRAGVPAHRRPASGTSGVRIAWEWFEGAQRRRAPDGRLRRPAAGYDGLEAGGRNENRGAESTLAAIGHVPAARELGIVGGRR